MPDDERPPEWLVDVEVKLAYQERLITDLDTLVRELGARLDQTQRELTELKQSIASPAGPVGAANEAPPHY